MTNAMISSEEAQSYQSKGLSPRRRTYEVGMRGLLYLSAGITCLLLLFLIGYILYRGLPNLNWTFLTSQESVLRGTDGIMPAIQNTLYVIVVTLIFILPLGVGAAASVVSAAPAAGAAVPIAVAARLVGLPQGADREGDHARKDQGDDDGRQQLGHIWPSLSITDYFLPAGMSVR